MDQSPEFDVDDAVVLLLGGSERGELRGITRLEKLVFLLERETEAGVHLTQDTGFEAYNFGPFSKRVYQAVDTLSAAGLIEDSAQLSASADDTREASDLIGGDSAVTRYSTRDLKLTPLGLEYLGALREELPSEVTSGATALRQRFDSWTLRNLVRYVYQRYPTYAENSLIRDEILGGDR